MTQKDRMCTRMDVCPRSEGGHRGKSICPLIPGFEGEPEKASI